MELTLGQLKQMVHGIPHAENWLEALDQLLPDYEINTWNALLAPKGTPPAVVARLNAAIAQAMKSPDLIQRFEREGATPVTSSPEQLNTFIASEIVKWGKVVDRTPMSTN